MKPKVPSGNSSPSTTSPLDTALGEIEALGIPLPRQPLYDGQPLPPQLTADLTLMGSVELGSYMSKIGATADYATTYVALCDIETTAAKHDHEVAYAAARFAASGTVQEKEVIAKTHPTVIQAKKRLDHVEAKLKMMTALLRNYERMMTAVSREMTRRQMERQKERTP